MRCAKTKQRGELIASPGRVPGTARPLSEFHAYRQSVRVIRAEDALAALDRLYLAAGMYEDLAEILRRRIEVVQDGEEQVELYFRRGAIFADALADLA